jgi:hypothetical protein
MGVSQEESPSFREGWMSKMAIEELAIVLRIKWAAADTNSYNSVLDAIVV